MSKRATQPSYKQPIDCMASPCVRHAAQMIEQALYEADHALRPWKDGTLGPRTNGVGLIVGPLFPKRVEHPHWRKAYAAELDANPHLLSILTGNRGIDGVWDAAALTDEQREAIDLRGYGLGVREIGRQLGISHVAVLDRLNRGLRKLKDTLTSRDTNGGALHVA